ncbi:MAG: hypothetical protein J1E34_06050 [Oscillospiraceae bacterium]|nr:hypothetical protein [Oscillospiraceae bacterium]
MNIHKKKKERLSEKKYVKRVLSVYFAVNMMISAVFCVTAGVQYAKRGTEKVWFGETEEFIQSEDIKIIAEKIKDKLFYLK